jgi:hypothetical protein
MPELYVGTLRVGAACESEVDAELVFEGLREQVEQVLDLEEGDFATVTQVIPFEAREMTSRQEIADVLRRDRNILIRTKVKHLWDIARAMDEAIHVINTGNDEMQDYDYGHFLIVAEAVLKGENPID